MDGIPLELLTFAYPPRVVGSPPTSHVNPLVTHLTAVFNYLLDPIRLYRTNGLPH
jgi:hypothetical protein